jgi:isopenicillin-N N-acyltransferase like protein
MKRASLRVAGTLLILMLGSGAVARAETRTVARCGAGFLEEVDGYRVLHLKGDPYEMGYQQGALLRDDIREQVHFLFDVKARQMTFELGGVKMLDPKQVIKGISARQRKFVPERYFDEMRGIADGAGMNVQDIIVANFIPELFHCSGFALSGSATKDGTLYHGRVLDYGCDWKLQEHTVLTVAEPAGRIPFVNVTYAGFVGSVTGMNAERISIGEMGGRGMGHWDGMPMALLVRMALEEADSLDRAIAVFRDHPRTCEYYYVIADGETGKAVGMEGSWDVFGTIAMGESHPKLPNAVKDAVVLSAGDRYKELSRRVQQGRGTFDAESARHLMDRPVAMKSNLHSVLFETTTTRFWVANASKDGKPAVEQPYSAFQLRDLLKHQPDPSATTLPAPPSDTRSAHVRVSSGGVSAVVSGKRQVASGK